MGFKEAVCDCEEISEGFRPGLEALSNYSNRVLASNPRHCEGSVNIDEHLKRIYPNANRWDFALGYAGHTYFVEVHPATTGEIKNVVRKKQWLKTWMQDKATALLSEPQSYHWIATENTAITKQSSHFRKLAGEGIKLEGRILRIPGKG